MPDPESSETSAPSTGTYPASGHDAIPASVLKERIRQHGFVSFPEFMATALYHPEGGYYTRPETRVGRTGDFYTSVSTGPLLGRLLARHILDWWQKNHRPSPWRILEPGAHHGELARDILLELRLLHSGAFTSLRYAIPEPLHTLARTQRQQLAPVSARLEIVSSPGELKPLPGFLVANEVIDALPFHVLESDGQHWIDQGVSLDHEGNFLWRPLGAFKCDLPLRPAGYRTEFRPDLADFLRPLAAILSSGRMLLIDYGFERQEYLDPARTEGTLRTFHRHRADDDPLIQVGSQDITAHVDFHSLRDAIEGLGGTITNFENQARFLTRIARPWLLELEGKTDPETRKLLRNFQTLTHPAYLGTRFHFIEAEW